MAAEAFRETLLPYFGEAFLEDHAGRIISDPYVAIVELVANCWDAGARKVDITWPDRANGRFQIIDDGTGMTRAEFIKIWRELNYDRVTNQGSLVIFPDQITQAKRTAYGRNGKGRHSLFCFAEEYYVETWKNGLSSTFRIKRSYGDTPYRIEPISEDPKDGHGTRIYCDLIKNPLSLDDIKDVIGSKFITDPSFTIYVNSHKIDLFDLKGTEYEEYEIPNEGIVKIIRLDSKIGGRTSKQHGVAWWVNNRIVGEHSWKGFEGVYLDGRKTEAKRYTIIVIADFLIDEVRPDWTSFRATVRANKIIKEINEYIYKSIQKLMYDSRKSTKIEVIAQNKAEIKRLNNLSKEQIGIFIDEVQIKCPTMTPEHLSNAVGILAKMEYNRSGYTLLSQLAELSSKGLDALSSILDQWSIFEAKEVLRELYWRLDLIQKMENLVDNPGTNELHELQPLFETGLWIFGPEYEGIQYLSNKTLATILKEFFGGGEIEYPQRRPDFIALPDRSIGVYAREDYDSDSEVCGIKKILIVELKKGGSIIKDTERRQAEDYAIALVNSGKLNEKTKIMCYVLGARVQSKSITIPDENIEVIPCPYSTILQKAHARTFHLIRKIKEGRIIDEIDDKEIKEVLAQKEITDVPGPN